MIQNGAQLYKGEKQVSTYGVHFRTQKDCILKIFDTINFYQNKYTLYDIKSLNFWKLFGTVGTANFGKTCACCTQKELFIDKSTIRKIL